MKILKIKIDKKTERIFENVCKKLCCFRKMCFASHIVKENKKANEEIQK